MDWVHLFFDHNCSSCLQVARPHQGFFNSNGQHYLTGLVVNKNQIFKAKTTTLLQSRAEDELKSDLWKQTDTAIVYRGLHFTE